MRKQDRQPVSRPAQIELGDGKWLSCRVADVSEGGSLLIVPDSEWLPKSFVLHDTFLNTRRQVQVMWTSPNRAGVRYIGGAPIVPTARKPAGFGKRVREQTN